MQFISRFCTSAILMERGKQNFFKKDVNEVIPHYLSKFQPKMVVIGEANINIINSEIYPNNLNDNKVIIDSSSDILMKLLIKCDNLYLSVIISIVIIKEDDSPVISFKEVQSCNLNLRNNLILNLGKLPLASGNYSFNVAFINSDSKVILKKYQSILPFTINSGKAYWSNIILPIKEVLM